MSRIDRITVHHSAVHADREAQDRSAEIIRSIQKNHQRDKGWGDIGYHYLIDREGRVWTGRPEGWQGAHAGDPQSNRGNLGVCLMGNFVSRGGQTPAPAQLQAPRAAGLAALRPLPAEPRPHRHPPRDPGHGVPRRPPAGRRRAGCDARCWWAKSSPAHAAGSGPPTAYIRGRAPADSLLVERHTKATAAQRFPLTPGTTATCVLLTAMTLLTATFTGDPHVDPVLRPLFFALLFSFFHGQGRIQAEIRVLPFRLIECGFLVLTLGFSVAAVIHVQQLANDGGLYWHLLNAMERGAVYLLGITLISYGIILWLPHLLESQRVLRARYDRTRDRLEVSEDARSADGTALPGGRPVARARRARRRSGPRSAQSRWRSSRVPPTPCREASAAARTWPSTPKSSAATSTEPNGRSRRCSSSVGPPDSSITEVDLSASLHEVMRLVEVEARRRNIRISAPQSELRALADPRLLAQALLNLVLNALQASPARASIELRVRAFTLAGNDLAAIAVDDQGTGLDLSARDKLFTPFFTTKQGGTGLGLLSSRRILAEIGGAIALYPRTRGGTRALILLPRAAAQVPQTHA